MFANWQPKAYKSESEGFRAGIRLRQIGLTAKCAANLAKVTIIGQGLQNQILFCASETVVRRL